MKRTSTTKTRKRQKTTQIPAYFLSLTIENIRSFGPEQIINFTDGNGRPAQWTVILGDNGVGKTTLLQALCLLVPLPNPSLGNYIQNTPRLSPLLKNVPDGKLNKVIYPNFFSDLNNELSNYVYKNFPSEKKINLVAKVETGAKLMVRNGIRGTTDLFIKQVEEGIAFCAYYNDPAKDLACFGYGATRRMGETSLAERGEDRGYTSLFNDDAPLINAEEWLLQSDYAAHVAKGTSTRKQAQKRRDEIKDVLLNLLPDVDDIRFVNLTEKKMKPGVEVHTPYGWVSIKELSLGYKTLVAWMVDFASRMFERYPKSPNPLAEPAVVLIDEIDLHLHPKWQRTLMDFLSERFPNTQFIATAHSPLVVQAAGSANIVLLKRQGDHVVIENDIKAIHGWRVDQILTSDLFGLESARPPQLDTLLEERANILSKARLTKKDKERLSAVEDEIGSLPTGETPEDMEAMDVIRRAAKRLKAQGY